MDGGWINRTDHLDAKDEDMNLQTYGFAAQVRNAYPLMTVGGVYDNQRATTSQKRYLS